MNRYYFITILSFCIIAGYSQNDKKDYTEALRLVEVWLEAQKDFERLPGITAIIIEDQKILWSGAFGMSNIEGNIKADPSTLFSICSVSKLFTSIAIMKLYDEGKLRLDDRVSDILPWYNLEQKFPESGPITIRSLLTHSSGLPREANFPYWTGPDFPFPTREKIRQELSKQETLYSSSTYFQYSNLGLTLLGEIVEEISGIPYDEFINKNILEPLGLKNTRTDLPESLYGKELSIGYSALTRNGEREKVNFFHANGIKAAAGFSSSVLDLGKFASWQFRLADTTAIEILKPSTLKYMQNVHWTDPDWKTIWGLGFKILKGPDESKLVGHGGGCPGYRTGFIMNPKSKKAYVVMINANGTDPEKYITGINAIMNKAENEKKSDTLKDGGKNNDLMEFTGYYSPMPWNSEMYISMWNGKLVSINLPTETPVSSMSFYKHIEGDTFRRIREDSELGETLVFERNDKGEITQFKQHGNYSKKINR